jgi:quercetin dioxygenase-like cupin family protein
MLRRTILIGASVALLASCAGVAPATPAASTPPSPAPQAVKSELLARGAVGEFAIRDQDAGLLLTAEKPTDLALVKATLVAGGKTGWHTHAGDSIVVVTKGSVTMREPGDGSCMEHGYTVGQAFAHPRSNHDVVAGPEGAEFFVAYFLPAGAAPAPVPQPAPTTCP